MLNYKTFDVGIDSMTVLTPIDSFDYVPDDFYDQIIQLNESTGEVLSSSVKPIYAETRGVKTRAFILSLFGVDNLAITVNAKMLSLTDCNDNIYSMFPAINIGNIRYLHSLLQNTFKLQIEFERWLNESTVNDCDFKADFRANDHNFEDFLKSFSRCPSIKYYYSKNKKRDVREKKRINGAQFVNRNDASIRNPFVKFYSKYDELVERSPEYLDAFLPNWNDFTYRRAEVTVRNSKHWKSLDDKYIINFSRATLYDVIKLSPFECLEIIKHLISRHSNDLIQEIIQTAKPIKKITPSMFLLSSTVHALLEQGYTFNNILAFMDGFPTDSDTKTVAKSRMKSRLVDALAFLDKKRKIDNLRVTAKDAFLAD